MKKKWVRCAAFVCSMAISSLLMNFNVSAAEMQHIEIQQEVSANQTNWWLGQDGEISKVNGAIGNNISVYCAHSLVSGEFAIHNAKGDGGCTSSVYDAKKCTKCGTVFVNGFKYSVDYKVCIH